MIILEISTVRIFITAPPAITKNQTSLAVCVFAIGVAIAATKMSSAPI